MNNLSVQLVVNPQCQLVAIDNTNYTNLVYNEDFIEDLTQHVSLEFLVYIDEDYPISSTVIFKEYLHKREEYSKNVSTISFEHDGTHTYYKLLVPRLEHMCKVQGNKYSIRVKDEVFYYKGNFYLGVADIIDVDELTTDVMTTVVNNSTKIINLLDI